MSHESEADKIKLEDLREAFGEGVLRTAEEGWVGPDQIEDKGFRRRYTEICDLWSDLRDKASSMENDLDCLPSNDDE